MIYFKGDLKLFYDAGVLAGAAGVAAGAAAGAADVLSEDAGVDELVDEVDAVARVDVQLDEAGLGQLANLVAFRRKQEQRSVNCLCANRVVLLV